VAAYSCSISHDFAAAARVPATSSNGVAGLLQNAPGMVNAATATIGTEIGSPHQRVAIATGRFFG